MFVGSPGCRELTGGGWMVGWRLQGRLGQGRQAGQEAAGVGVARAFRCSEAKVGGDSDG